MIAHKRTHTRERKKERERERAREREKERQRETEREREREGEMQTHTSFLHSTLPVFCMHVQECAHTKRPWRTWCKSKHNTGFTLRLLTVFCHHTPAVGGTTLDWPTGPADAFHVMDFDLSAKTTVEKCLDSRMVPATSENKVKLKKFVDTILYNTQARGTTGFDAAFDKVDSILRDELSVKVIGDKPVMVLFMTDGGPDVKIPKGAKYYDTIKSWKTLENIQPPTLLAFGFGLDAKMDVLHAMMQESSGKTDTKATQVSEYDTRSSMAAYYQHAKLAHPSSSAGAVLSTPYWNIFGRGWVVTLSMPLFDDRKTLWGM